MTRGGSKRLSGPQPPAAGVGYVDRESSVPLFGSMQRKALWIAAGAAGILAAGRLMYGAGQAERAGELSQRAALLLHAPFDEAPAYADLRATEARLLVE